MTECELVYLQLTEGQVRKLRSITWEHIQNLVNKDENLGYVREIMKIYFAIGGKDN